MSKILITGFDAFGGESINPAPQALQHMERSDSRIGGA
jgi:pyrrolidone-carboxylate peptidase